MPELLSNEDEALLDDFAKAALEGLAVGYIERKEFAAKVCYNYAEAMLSERNRRREARLRGE